jgi:hypothetical protein
MPDIFHKNDSSSVSSAWMIFLKLLCKLEYTEVHNLRVRLGKRYTVTASANRGLLRLLRNKDVYLDHLGYLGIT